jgi:lysophospholipase L1-like esterase
VFGAAATAAAPAWESKPEAPFFEKFLPQKAPRPSGLLLRAGDRLAICSDSITEQKMYSRILETYLTVCVSDLAVTVRPYGWSGERAAGFLARMTNDCLRFQPTVATTCYGMNDHEYRAYQDRIGRTYREKSTAIVQAFKAHGVRVVLGSPGCLGKVPPWAQNNQATVEEMNLSLGELRHLGIAIAQQEQVGFADVFWPMLTAGLAAQQLHGPDFAVAGKDGVHPGWAGHAVMAYAFLKALGLDGEIGTFRVDWARQQATVSAGHERLALADGTLEIRSHRYPFCAPAGELSRDDNVRAGLALVPFDQELNRLMLVIQNGTAARYRVTWGSESRVFDAEQLGKGINLAHDFPVNPFGIAFAKVDAAVAAKQAYETRQIKDLFHGPEGKTDPEMTAQLTEKVRDPLAAAIREAFVPVTHTIRIAPQ